MLAVVALNNLHGRTVSQGVEILVLAFGLVVVGGLVDDTGGEIFDGSDLVIVTQEGFGERNEVEPFVRRAAQKSIVEVASVDVNDGFLHSASL